MYLLHSGFFLPIRGPPEDDARYHKADTAPQSYGHSLQRLPVVTGKSGDLHIPSRTLFL